VKAAQQLGISVRRFDGWEPTTYYEYDDEGRLVSSTPEPEWDERQQAYMLALLEYEARICPGCGHPLYISGDEEHNWDVEPIRCWACDAVAQARAKDERLRPEALHWHSRRR
jgi:hypothetical protein